jgi:hypothetical protein
VDAPVVSVAVVEVELPPGVVSARAPETVSPTTKSATTTAAIVALRLLALLFPLYATVSPYAVVTCRHDPRHPRVLVPALV